MKRYGLIFGFALATGLGVLFYNSSAVGSAGAQVASLVSGSATASTTVASTGQDAALDTVVADMEAAIAQYAGSSVEVAATLIDLDSGQQYDAGETGVVFKAASTAKVLAAVDYLHEVEAGNATLGQTIDGMTAQQAMQQMIEVSDNQAWAAFNDYLGDKQQAYAESIGLDSFTGGDYNTMTAADEAKLLALLYRGELITSQNRELLYGFMANTDSSDLIQAALPADATVYHKYGQLWGNLHDAAIVSYEGRNFALVIFTKNSSGTTDDYASRVALVHAVAKAAFDDVMAGAVE